MFYVVPERREKVDLGMKQIKAKTAYGRWTTAFSSSEYTPEQ
jgi:hypothetical protein